MVSATGTAKTISIATWNVNGLRSASESFRRWMTRRQPTVACLQETRLGVGAGKGFGVPGYRHVLNCSQRAGHSGTAIYARAEVLSTAVDVLGTEGDGCGRSILVELEAFRVLNVYMPHGGRDGSRLSHKLAMYDALHDLASRDARKPMIIVGDMNIAHQDIDLSRPRQNRHRTMFTTAERARLGALLDAGYVDAFRVLHPDARTYSWWPYAHDCRARNIGWRIDNVFIHRSIIDSLTDCRIEVDVPGSDHCPVSVVLADRAEREAPVVADAVPIDG